MTDKTSGIKSARSCPNAECEPGAILLGFKAPSGRIMNLRSATPVDADFVATAREIGPPEQRMRFAAPCKVDGCTKWKDGRCSIADQIVSKLGETDGPINNTLPSCPIRRTCQWYAQRGASACIACELFVTQPTNAASAGGQDRNPT